MRLLSVVFVYWSAFYDCFVWMVEISFTPDRSDKANIWLLVFNRIGTCLIISQSELVLHVKTNSFNWRLKSDLKSCMSACQWRPKCLFYKNYFSTITVETESIETVRQVVICHPRLLIYLQVTLPPNHGQVMQNSASWETMESGHHLYKYTFSPITLGILGFEQTLPLMTIPKS